MMLFYLGTSKRQSLPPRPLSEMIDTKPSFKHSKSESDIKDQEVAVITEKIESKESYVDRGKQHVDDICEVEEQYLVSEYLDFLTNADPNVCLGSNKDEKLL